MKNKTRFYVSLKNPLTWLMTLCMVCSAVARILFIGTKGADPWSQIVLPIAASLLFTLIVLISGREHFYKTAIPFWLMAGYYAFLFFGYSFGTYDVLISWLLVIMLVFVALLYTQITSGRGRHVWVLAPLVLLPFAAQLYLERHALMAGQYLPLLADGLIALGFLLTVFAMHPHTDGNYHPTWGDRNDGRRLRTLDPMSQITMYFQWERDMCSNLFEESLEITHVERYIHQKRREGLTDFGITHVLLSAYVRALCKYPQLNRFISGQKVYSRDDDVQYCMVVKKEMSVESPDTSIKIHLNRRNTAAEVYEKLKAAVAEVKATQELDSSLDNLIGYLNLIPGVVLKFVVWLLKLLDYFGLLPKFLLELSPFHGSLFFTSMGSLGIKPVFHHLYNFGNLPAFGAFGLKRRALEVQEDGTVVQRKYIDMKFTVDERIADGYCYAAFFKHFRSILRHPEIMDEPPVELVRDID